MGLPLEAVKTWLLAHGAWRENGDEVRLCDGEG